jgi:hypothetical protein
MDELRSTVQPERYLGAVRSCCRLEVGRTGDEHDNFPWGLRLQRSSCSGPASCEGVWWHDVVFPESSEEERREASKCFDHARGKVCARLINAGVDASDRI